MCGRFTLFSPVEIIKDLFSLTQDVEVTPRYNIAPTQQAACIRSSADGPERELVFMRWGLIPFWAKNSRIGARMINARAETVAEKPAFRHAFLRRRCLVPADGFYEWAPTAKGPKQPHLFYMIDRLPFAFAGLWEQWREGRGESIESFTIVTTEANEAVQPIHHRMPVILARQEYSTWLDDEATSPHRLTALLRPYPADQMACHAVGLAVNNPQFDDPMCCEPQ